MDPLAVLVSIVLVFLLLYIYIRINDAKLMVLPPDVAAAFSPERFTEKSVKDAFARQRESPVTIGDRLPPKTGRRYIVTGGAGFLGGWIVRHLVERGEDPRRIRVLDIRAPSRPDLTTGAISNVDFRLVDISNRAAVDEAFDAPWPDGATSNAETTVFHTAAGIRFYERHEALLPRSAKVNVDGTQHVLDAARRTGVRVLVYTSSGSVLVRRTRLWLWPWERQARLFTQAFTDDSPVPMQHDETFSNYAVTKIDAERRVRAANGTTSGDGVLRTGCIRPSNGVYGPGGDILCGAYLVRQVNPTWIGSTLQNFVYVENASLAHLCFEARLLAAGARGGDAFLVADRGPPATYGDVYLALRTLTDGQVRFPTLSATGMLLLAQALEALYLARTFMLDARSALVRRLGALVPALNGDIVNLQPSLFSLTSVHLVFDDSRARAAPEQGGLGYAPVWSTLEGLCTLVDEHIKAGGRGEERSLGGGVSFGFASSRAGRGVGQVMEKMGVDPVLASN